MGPLVLSLVLATVVGWCLLAGRLGRVGLTAPIVFVAAGLVLAEVSGSLDLLAEPHLVKVLAEVTLVWVLFADASAVRPRDLRADLGLYVRLLGVGLPLTVVLGRWRRSWCSAVDPWAALLVGAALAPTDAALGAAVMSDRAVPATHATGAERRERAQRRHRHPRRPRGDRRGAPSRRACPGSRTRATRWSAPRRPAGRGRRRRAGGRRRPCRRAPGAGCREELAGPATLAAALLCYTGALLVDGNGFVAAFVGGLAFGAVARERGEKEVYFVEQTADLAAMMSWLVFGALAMSAWRTRSAGRCSATASSASPSSGWSRWPSRSPDPGSTGPTRLFVGWFGPGGWPRSSSRCWRWRTCTAPARTWWRSSR